MAASGSPQRHKMGRLLSILNPLTWKKRLDLDSQSVLMMMKGALAPTIVIAISQSDAVSRITTTIGYLAAIMAVTAQCLMPRAKFMKIFFFDILAVCTAAALCCLVTYCAVKAREHNTPADAPESVKSGYSSDACAVSAVWFIFMIWGANVVRAWRPTEMQDPMVAFSIFSVVTITRTGTFVTVPQGLEFVSRVLQTFLIGFAIAAAVSLIILPTTSRSLVFDDIKSYVTQIEAVLESQISFVEGNSSMSLWMGNGLLSRTRTARSIRDTESSRSGGNETRPSLSKIEQRVKDANTKLNAIHAKLHSDLFYSRDEIAWGKLSAGDMVEIGGLFRALLLPLSGMSMLPEILEMIIKNEGPREISDMLGESEEEIAKRSEMQRVVATLHEGLTECMELVTVGLQYFLLTLQLMKPKHLAKQQAAKSKGQQPKDEESKGDSLNPLQSDFSSLFEHNLREFYARRKVIAQALSSLQAFSNAEKYAYDVPPQPSDNDLIKADPDVRQEFFLILYMGHLQESPLNATLELIKFADSKVSDGTMKSGRLIFPKQESVRDWFSIKADQEESQMNLHDRRPSTQDDRSSLHEEQEATPEFPDPEHLPPANIWEKGSGALRTISRFISSRLSLFGFRVAAAAFSVAILAFLHQTQQFFIHQRVVWALIVIVIGMSPTSGQTLFGFIARVLATVVSLVLSLIVWYIVDEKTAGVIVFLYLANVFEYYFYVKKPQIFGPTVISIVTLNVIIGYELQARKLGIEVATSNGQPFYPIYLFGPYKLATVAAGVGISFFWTIFPYPITAKSKVRHLLGRSLFVLAEFYSAMHTTVELWMSGELGCSQDPPHRPYHRLEKTRYKLFKEGTILLNTLRTHSRFTTFEPPIGGKFPKAVYDDIISGTQGILTSMSLMVHTIQHLEDLSLSESRAPGPSGEQWISQLARIALNSSAFRSQATTSLLYHISSSIDNGQPLPPNLSVPRSFPLARQLQRINGELLSIRHVEDPAFSAFVSLEVLRTVINFSLKDLLENAKTLVGELSFGFQVRQTHLYEESTRLTSNTAQEDDSDDEEDDDDDDDDDDERSR